MLHHYSICGTDATAAAFVAFAAAAGAASCVVACFKAMGIWRIATSAIVKSPVESTSRELVLLLKGLHEKLLLK